MAVCRKIRLIFISCIFSHIIPLLYFAKHTQVKMVRYTMSFESNDFNAAIRTIDGMLSSILTNINPNEDISLKFKLEITMKWDDTWLRSRSDNLVLTMRDFANHLPHYYVGETVANHATAHHPRSRPRSIIFRLRVSNLWTWIEMIPFDAERWARDNNRQLRY